MTEFILSILVTVFLLAYLIYALLKAEEL
ncbi:MAG: K(+)-transporting ATPase subunit F [Chitinophagales bacterium]